MGCDGGTIPKRDELVRTKKKPEEVNIYNYFSINAVLNNLVSRIVCSNILLINYIIPC